MKNIDLKKEVASIEQKNKERKNKITLFLKTSKLMFVFGWALIVLFIADLIITHYLLLGMVSTLLFVQDMPVASVLFASMNAQFFLLFVLAILGIAFVLLGIKGLKRMQELSR